MLKIFLAEDEVVVRETIKRMSPLEKMRHYKRSSIDVLKDVLPELDTDEGRRLTLVEECHDRWVENARASRSGRSGRKEVQP